VTRSKGRADSRAYRLIHLPSKNAPFAHEKSSGFARFRIAFGFCCDLIKTESKIAQANG
jgi:hypothetical protein